MRFEPATNLSKPAHAVTLVYANVLGSYTWIVIKTSVIPSYLPVFTKCPMLGCHTYATTTVIEVIIIDD